jgi:hypothetical protein
MTRVGGVVRLLYIALFYGKRRSSIGPSGIYYRVVCYLNSFGVEFFGTNEKVEVVGVKRLFALWD